jgi:hypothetical protein
MFNYAPIDTPIKMMSGNIFNMIIFDKFKTGKPIIDAFITTFFLTIFTYSIQYINDKFYDFLKFIKKFDYNFDSFFYTKNIVEYDGKIAISTTYYDSALNQTNSFSDRFKALWNHIIENVSENISIQHIKEYSFETNQYQRTNRDLGIYMVVQDKQFLISKDLEIYAYTIISNEEQDSDDKKSSGKYTKRLNKIEKIAIQLFSYKSDISTIKEFVEELTKTYLSSIEDLRDNKRFIYTLTKSKYDESRY